MIRSIEWSEDALADFESAIAYVSRKNLAAAARIADRVLSTIDNLADLPTGHQGRMAGTYEKLAQKTPYIVAYSMTDLTIYILRIIHGSRDWPEDQWPTE
ncbi:type II toxin-antitoxin system RelE/ParE family toxin [Aminobacter sp. AP02]|uniref:type II toxin-antitoxin system RelE/ParE family toxin n=1 Tax=Aminobacter sp. AP02 TaxID=2135737 RepID=UPI000D79D93A|nr:type II toxin-antitoxin system RelE/ParE family toxin [Aminobacter sp. AP02]PWK76341.1 plasmid stabilization system protein ParE [Aminobacter sp. AP02]